jgi:hypothetical protein
VLMRTDSEVIDAHDMPWYRFGTRFTDVLTADQAVRAARLDWRVATRNKSQGSGAGSDVVVREDLWDQEGNGILGNLRGHYIPFQNVEAFTFLDVLVQTGTMEYDSAGEWGQGERVWVMLRVREEVEIAPRDLLAQFLLILHAPHNGHHRLTYLPVRVASCSILSEEAFYNPEPLITSFDVRPRRFQVPTEIALEEIRNHFKNLVGKFKAMRKLELGSKEAYNYFLSVFETFGHLHKKSAPTVEETKKACDTCVQLLRDGRANDLPGVRGTLWAAYAAFDEYFDFYKAVPTDWRYLPDIWLSPLKASALSVATKLAAKMT